MKRDPFAVYGKVAGGLYLAVAFLTPLWYFLFPRPSLDGSPWSAATLLYYAGTAFLGVMLLAGRRNLMCGAGAGALALVILITLVLEISDGAAFGELLPDLLSFLGYLALAFVLAVCLVEEVDRFRPIGQAAWFLPAALLVLSACVPVVRSYVMQFEDELRPSMSGMNLVLSLLFTALIAGAAPLLASLWAARSMTPEELAREQAKAPRVSPPPYRQPAPQPPYQQPYRPYQPPYQPAAPAESEAARQIRECKRLLDDGLITQEEYEAKKKQLLGL